MPKKIDLIWNELCNTGSAAALARNKSERLKRQIRRIVRARAPALPGSNLLSSARYFLAKSPAGVTRKVDNGVKGFIHRFDPDQARREIDEELRFHIDLLTDEHCLPDVPLAEARDAALRRFGNVEQIKNECVEISRRRHPAIRLLKSFLLLVFLTGVLVRVFSPEYNLMRVGGILMAVSVLGHLWLYVRGLNPSSFLSEAIDSAPLKLNDSPVSFTAYDQRKRTPVERVISAK